MAKYTRLLESVQSQRMRTLVGINEEEAYNLQLLRGRVRSVWAPCNREFLNFMPIYDSD